MKHFLTSLLMALAICNTSQVMAQDESNGKYSLQNGHLTMTIDASKGGKILSFQYDGKEVISQSKWPETFGSTFWTSPQKEWFWPPVPEYDKHPYQVEKEGDVLKMTSEVSEKLKYRIQKEFKVDEQHQCMVVTYSIVNESNEPKKVAPWEITRVPNEGGLIFFDALVDSIKPAGLMAFNEAYQTAWYQADVAQENRKINADGKGWLAYCANGLLMVKCFDDLTSSQPAPEEAEIQVYVNKGKTYIELESQGAYTTLQPQERLSWTVRWYLQPCSATPTPSESLLQQVKNIVEKD